MDQENNYAWWRLAGDEWSEIWKTLEVSEDKEYAFIKIRHYTTKNCCVCNRSLSRIDYVIEQTYGDHSSEKKRYCMAHLPTGIEFA